MERIAVIQNVECTPAMLAHFSTRTASRAVLWHGGTIALLKVGKYHYHKLPGGGIDPGESIEQALRREILEETGCTIRIIGEIGEIIEYRDYAQVVQTSYCFTAEVVEEGRPQFTEHERAEEFSLLWVPIDEAIRLVANDRPKNQEGEFIVKRDLQFLKKAKQLRESH